MSTAKPLSHLAETYKFWEVVTQWVKERLEHEEIVARALSRAVIYDGLALNNVDKHWLFGSRNGSPLRGHPFVGYCQYQMPDHHQQGHENARCSNYELRLYLHPPSKLILDRI